MSTCLNDGSFGPIVRGCRDDFDFTVLFELIFLYLVPAGVFTAVALTRAFSCLRRPAVVRGGLLLRASKLVLAASYSALTLALLVLSITSNKSHAAPSAAIAADAVGLVAALSITALSFLEHSKSARPSILLGGYLFLTLLLDVVRARTQWLIAIHHDHSQTTYARLLTSAVSLKALMLFAEAQAKDRWLYWEIKDHSPEETSGPHSLGLFIWLSGLLMSGYRGVLNIPDLYPLDSALSADVLRDKYWSRLRWSPLRGKKLGLARALLQTLAVPLLIAVPARLFLIAFTFCQPMLIEALLNYLQASAAADADLNSIETRNFGYGLIGATLLTYGGISVATALYWYFQERALFMVRGVLVLAVYEKTTAARLSPESDSEAITLMSTDVERVHKGCLDIHEYWASMVEVGLACWLLQQQLGAAFAAPLVVVVFCAVGVSVLGGFLGKMQKDWMEAVQKRVGTTAAAIGQMKLIKISGLATLVEDRVQALRVVELRVGGRWRRALLIAVGLSSTPLLLSPVATFAVTSKDLNTTSIFVSVSYITLLASPLMSLFQSLPQLLGALTCLARIQAYLEADERIDSRRVEGSPALSEKAAMRLVKSEPGSGKLGEMMLEELSPARDSSDMGSAVRVSGGVFGYDSEKPILRDVNIAIPYSRFTIIEGPVAAGKSTLCKALLGELPHAVGEVSVHKRCVRIGYCDQTPFLTNATIRDNIIGFGTFDAGRYESVVHAAMLETDFAILPKGDGTMIGSSGIALSGGQRQRVSLARALYLESDLLIMDDVLSGLDATTEEHVVRHTFGRDGLLRQRGATAVLCTHNTRLLASADHVITIKDDGTITERSQDVSPIERESPYNGSSSTSKASEAPAAETSSQVDTKSTGPQESEEAATDDDDAARNDARLNGDKGVYRYWFGTANRIALLAFLLSAICRGVFMNFPQIWLTYWSDDIAKPPSSRSHSNAYYIGIYGLLQVLSLSSLLFAAWTVIDVIIRQSGAEIHLRALQAVTNAPLRFFTATDTGVVTNLFSQDITLIDGQLPVALVNVVLQIFTVFGMAAIIASSSPWLALTYPALVAVLWVLQRFYLRTSRQLRLLDLEAKSPLYSHFLDTIKGVSSLRAFAWIPDSKSHNGALLDTSQRPMYLLHMIQRWLTVTLDVLVMIVATVLVALITQLKASSSLSGASLVTLMTLSKALSYIVTYYTDMETSIGAVTRLRAFATNTKSENRPGEDLKPEASWPPRGKIELKGVQASYTSDGEEPTTSSGTSTPSNLALRSVDLTIEPGEKIAICGRSGSGKSSLLLLLLRLLDPLPTGSVLSIDDIPLSSINRTALRQRLITVPQDSVFLPAGSTVQENLDPHSKASAADCRSVLEALSLWHTIQARGGLDAELTADTLSHGQRQLFSLARAVLKRRIRAALDPKGKGPGGGGVLLLDEFSSSVDRETEEEMLRVVHEEFGGYTVVMVSHRLEMVLGFDRVVVMDRGRVVEMGAPGELKNVEGGWFAELLRASLMEGES